MKQYKFTSRSAFSFAVTHNGRQMYVTFSPAYRGQAYYITTDEALAEKIRKHRWYREGRINEQVVDIKGPSEEKKFTPTAPPEPKKYSILGRSMASTMPSASVVAPSEERPASFPEEDQNPKGQVPTRIVADEVSSFMEAKEFFITNFGVQRSDVANKDAVAALCKEFGVVFHNYPL